MVEEYQTAGLARQIYGYFRADPKAVIVYGVATVLAITRFVFAQRTPAFGIWRRFGLVMRYLRIHFNVPGAVTLLECLVLADRALAAGPGCFVEVGAFQGRSTCCLSLIAEFCRVKLVVIDTFDGLPGSDDQYSVSDDPSRTYTFAAGEYRAGQAQFMANLRTYGAPGAVEVIVGDVGKIGASLRLPAPVSFAFLDVDLRASYVASLEAIGSSFREGAIVAFHEGLLRPVRTLIEDAAFWHRYGFEVRQIDYLGGGGRLRSLLAIASLSKSRD